MRNHHPALRRLALLGSSALLSVVMLACDEDGLLNPSPIVRPMDAGAGAAGRAAPPLESDAEVADDAAVGEADAGDEDAAAPDQDAGTDEGQPVAACGTRGGVSCGADEFCMFPAGECGDTDRGGQCQATPEACTLILLPVCGCDLRSYGNECAAHAAGVSVRHAGACTPRECRSAGGRPELSDGASTPSCRPGEAEWMLGEVDEPGLCCLPPMTGRTCGGIAALECEAGEFCNYEEGAGGQGCDGTIADAAGTCQAQPDVCAEVSQPVCGCDHKSYGNPCEAHTAGVSVLHEGFCTEVDCDAAGGHPVDGIGPGPMCPRGEVQHTFITYSNGMIAIEGTACCVPR